MRLFGLMIVRNEADILYANLCHHLSAGVDRILVVDNGSSDGTDDLLASFQKTGRVQVTRYDGAFRQGEITTALAHEAYLQGADWILPIDADEFWCAHSGDLRGVLEGSTADGLEVEVVNFIQRREQLERMPDALMYMTHRVAEALGPVHQISKLVERRMASFVEIRYPPKWISRASLAIEVQIGNHNIDGIGGEKAHTDDIVCLHAPLRARCILEDRVLQSRRYADAGNDKVWHIYRWARLADTGELGREWLANSYQGGALDLDGERRPVVFDSRLRDLVAPWIGPGRNWELLASVGQTDSFCLPNPGEDPVAGILEKMASVEGWFSENEASLLMYSAVLAILEHPRLPLVEIGSYCGRSTIVLGSIVQAMNGNIMSGAARVYAIDPHEGETGESGSTSAPTVPTFEAFRANIERAGVAAVIEPIIRRSYEVSWSVQIGFLLVDGFHDYHSVRRDFGHFDAWLATGSYVAFHDCDPAHPDVQIFVGELMASGKFEAVLTVESLTILQKSGSPDPDLYNEVLQEMGDLISEAERLERLETGVRLLRGIWKGQVSRYHVAIADRDHAILVLQNELHTKVGECNRIISSLQAELLEKVGQRDQTIRELQTELFAKVGDRDRMIHDLQGELYTKVSECNRVIAALQERLGRLSVPEHLLEAPAGES